MLELSEQKVAACAWLTGSTLTVCAIDRELGGRVWVATVPREGMPYPSSPEMLSAVTACPSYSTGNGFTSE
ncbi:MAG: hypothetical protein ACR2RV_08135 [Verrucomicrobiales bacterium]